MAWYWPPGTSPEVEKYNQRRIRQHGPGVLCKRVDEKQNIDTRFLFGENDGSARGGRRKTEKQELDMYGDQLQRYEHPKSPRTTDYVPKQKQITEKPNNVDIRNYPEYQENMMDKNNQQLFGRATNSYKRPDSKTSALQPYDGSLPSYAINQSKNKMSTVFEPEPGSEGQRTPTKAYLEHQAEQYGSGQKDYRERTDNGHGSPGTMGTLGQNHQMRQQPWEPDNSVSMMKFELLKLIPKYQHIPDSLPPDQEEKLKVVVAHELRRTRHKVLEDVYLNIAASDASKDGWCKFETVTLALTEHLVDIDPRVVRLICARHVTRSHPGEVNYEKLLSFMGASLKQYPMFPPSPQDQVQEAPQQRAPMSRDVNKETEKLVKLITHQMTAAHYVLNKPKLDDDLQREYSEYDCLKPMQIQKVSYDHILPLTKTLLDRLIDRCDEGRESLYTINWRKFANILSQCVPKKDSNDADRSTWNKQDSQRDEDPRQMREKALREQIASLQMDVDGKKLFLQTESNWQLGFYELTRRLYDEDKNTNTRGYLDRRDVDRITIKCNKDCGLGLDEYTIDSCILASTKGSDVGIRRFLENIADRKTKDKQAAMNSYHATRPDHDQYLKGKH